MMELIGEHQSADDLANDAGTIGYEILTVLAVVMSVFMSAETSCAFPAANRHPPAARNY
jgi:hypothetical protein